MTKGRRLGTGWMLALALTLTGCNLEEAGPDGATELTFPEGTARASETSAFHIVDHSPVDGDVDQSRVRDIMVSFNAPPLAESLTESNVRLWRGSKRVPVTLVYLAETHTIRLVPEQPLAPHQRYRVEVTPGLMSGRGEPFRGADWSFFTAGAIGATTQTTLDRCVTPERLALFEAINRVRAQARQCGGAAKPAAEPLDYQCDLAGLAQSHAESMADQALLSHYSSDGATLPQRADAAGYAWQALGEDIARSTGVDIDGLTGGWLADGLSCDTLMDPDYQRLGIGRAIGRDGQLYWVLDLARPATPRAN